MMDQVGLLKEVRLLAEICCGALVGAVTSPQKLEALRDMFSNLCVSSGDLQILPDNHPSERHEQT